MPMEEADIQNLAQAIKNLNAPVNAEGARAVSLKLPEFWTDDPEVWFARIEAQFNTRAITVDGTKFDYVVSALDNSTASEVKAVLLTPPDVDRYGTIKRALLGAFGKSQAQKDAELLSLTGLGDKKPTALLRQIRSLNSDAETLRRALFLAQLPAEVRAVLAGQNIDDLDELADCADRIIEARQLESSPVAFAVATGRHRPYQPSTRRAPQPPATQNRSGGFICTYHTRFGLRAHNCQQGCMFAESRHNNASTSTNSGNAQAGR